MTAPQQNSGGLALASNLRPGRALARPASLRLASRAFPRRTVKFTVRKGMATGTQAGEIGGGVLTSAAPLLAISAAAGPFAPIVAGVGALISLIASFIGGGCGQACIVSSQTEQIYEVACADLEAVAKLGMLSQDEYLAGVQTMISAGQAALQQLQQKGDPKAAGGLSNLSKSTQTQVTFASSLPAAATTPLDLNQAQTAFINPSTTGWYSASVVSGNQLAMAYLQTIQSAPTTGVGVNTTAGTVTILGNTFSFIEVALIAGAAWLAYSFVE